MRHAAIELQLVNTEDARLGLRERGKQERLRRIKEAALDVFRSEGYESASTRRIAKKADVAIGTLFVYAQDKRDLLFLVLNEELDAIADHSISSVPEAGTTAGRIVTLLAPIYEYFARDLELARTTLHESSCLDLRVERSAQAQRFYARMLRWEQAIAKLLEDAEARGVMKVGDDAALLGRAIFTAHIGEVRRWLQRGASEPEQGIRELERLVRVIIGDREKPA